MELAMMNKKNIWILFSFLWILFFVVYIAPHLISVMFRQKKLFNARVENNGMFSLSPGLAQIAESKTVKNSQKYRVKEFVVVTDQYKGLSVKQVGDHKQLYAGYVAKRNEIDEKLQSVDKSKSNASYSGFRGLKISETFTRNASLLHELYFENIAPGKKIGKATEKLIIDNFGSLESFKDDLMATATAARGWALMCYNLDDKRVQNYLLDAHNQLVPVMTIPLLVIDIYEHAYMIDFGINKKEYLAVLWNNINWDVVEARVKALIVK